jgi:predicted phage terminase large subunit-like protein
MAQHTLEERELVRRALSNWKVTPATFAQKMSRGKWFPSRHLQYISLEITKAILRGDGRIIVSLPPRHGKSQFLSKWTSSWHLERFPDKNVILTSYSADLAEGFAIDVRDLFQLEENHALLDTRIREDKSVVGNFLTDKGGGMISVGLGGMITGRGAHLFLIDDFIKGIKEALSQTQRDFIWNWFQTVAYTRLEPGATMIILATRWHSDDLIGRLLTNFPEEWTYIEMPALAEEGDLIGRQPGEALFPERYPADKLLKIKKHLGTAFFGALYQQRPVDQTNKIADGDWLKIANPLEIPWNELKLGRFWDLAATEDGGDWTTGALQGFHRSTGNYYILNMQRKQLRPGEVENLVRNTAVLDGRDVDIYIEQEPGASGKALVEHYQTTVLKEFNVIAVPTSKNKIVRYQPLLAAAEAGAVYLYPAEWNQAYIREFNSVGGAMPHDDQMDVTGEGYTRLSGKKAFKTTWGRSAATSSKRNSQNMRRDLARFSLSSGAKRINGITFRRPS